MAVRVTKSGGIYIEISGDLSKFRQDLDAAKKLAADAGNTISKALGDSIDPNKVTRSLRDMTSGLMNAQRAAQAMKADFAGQEAAIREWGETIGVTGQQLAHFTKLQTRAFKVQAAKDFLTPLRAIQRQTGATNEEMNELAKSLGGVGNEFSKADKEIKSLGEELKDTAQKSTLLTDGLNRVLVGVAGALGLREVSRMASSWTDLTSRVTLATASMGEAEMALERITGTANRIYADLDSTAEIFLRNATAFSDLGYSVKEQLDFMEAMTDALTVSGAKGQRAEAVINAMAKAMMEGKLQGDNWNTVLQQGGRVVQALADGVGLTVSALRTMATDGKLTSGKVFAALTSQMEKLKQESESMPATVQDGVVRLKNQLTVLVGQFDAVSGASSMAINAMRDMGSTMEGAGSFIQNNQAAIARLREGISLLASSIPTVVAAYAGWKVATSSLGRNFLRLAANIRTAGITQAAFSDAMGLATRRATALGTVLMSNGPMLAVSALAGAVGYLATHESEATRITREYSQAIQGLQGSAEDTARAIAAMEARIKSMSEAQTQATLFESQKNIQVVLAELGALLDASDAFNKTGGGIMGGSVGAAATALKVGLSETLRAFRENQIAASDFQDAVYNAFTAGRIGKEQRDRVLELASSVEAARIESKLLEDRLVDVRSGLDEVAGSAHHAGHALRNLADVNFGTLLANVEFEIGKVQLSDRNKAVLENLLRHKVVEQGQIQLEGVGFTVSGLTPEALQSVNQLSAAYGALYDGQQALRNRSKSLSVDRTAFQAAQAYKDSADALTTMTLRTAELQASLGGASLDVAFEKINRQFTAQRNRITDAQRKLNQDARQWAKSGKLDAEAQGTIAAAKEQLALQLQELETQKELEKEIARRAQLEKDARTAADYYGQMGDLAGVYQAEIDLLEVKKLSAATDMERAAIAERIRIATAQRDISIPDLVSTGWMEHSKQAQQGYIDFFQKEVPGAYAAAADSFGTFVADIGVGTKSLGNAWADLGNTLNSTLHKILADLTSLYSKMILFGDMSGGDGKVGGLVGWLGSAMGGLFKNAQGNAFSAGTGLSSYRNSVVSSPTVFAFAQGGVPGVGLMGEKTGSPGEAIMPLVRTSNGDLGIKARTEGTGPIFVQPQVSINVINNTPAEVTTQTGQDVNGGFNIDVLINEIDNRMAQRVTSGTSRTGAALDRTRNLNRASALYS